MKVIKVGTSAQSRIAQACDRCRSKKVRMTPTQVPDSGANGRNRYAVMAYGHVVHSAQMSASSARPAIS